VNTGAVPEDVAALRVRLRDFDQIGETGGLIPILRELAATVNDHVALALEQERRPQSVSTEENAWDIDSDPGPANGILGTAPNRRAAGRAGS
jgi:hypothetical protein